MAEPRVWPAPLTAESRPGEVVQHPLAAEATAGPKHLIGFSDLTALHGALGRELGQVTVHGPGAASVGQLQDVATVASLQRLLQQPPAPGTVVAAGRTLGSGSAGGRLCDPVRGLAHPAARGRLAESRMRRAGRRGWGRLAGRGGTARRPRG